MTFHERLRTAREAKGMTQAELAEAVGTNQAAVSRWETGGTPRLVTIVRLAAVLDVDLAELVAA